MRCAIYARLSREDEDRGGGESESIRNQKSLLLRYAAERDWEVYGLYCDEDYSGADRTRPEFRRMIEDARQRKFQIVLCKTQSRFTRDMELVEKYIHGLFPRWGIRFIAVADNADSAVRGNKKARQINGLVNEWYLEDLSESIRVVLDHKRREGKFIGGYPVYGYRRDERDHSRILIDPEAAEVVRQIFRLALAGLGDGRIAARLNEMGIESPAAYKAGKGWLRDPAGQGGGVWTRTAVGRILRNEVYTGTMVQGRRRRMSYKSAAMVPVPEREWFRVEGTHEAIVDRDVFRAVAEKRQKRSKSDGRGETHPLSGLVFCADCGAPMGKYSTRRGAGEERSYLRCRSYLSGGPARCSSHSIRMDALLATVTERARGYLAPVVDTMPPVERRAARETERRRLEAEAERRSAALRQLCLDRASGLVEAEEFAELNRAILGERRAIADRLAALAAAQTSSVPPRPALPERLPRVLATALIRRVEVGQADRAGGTQNVKIVWSFPKPEDRTGARQIL